jgi:hypothetical protein
MSREIYLDGIEQYHQIEYEVESSFCLYNWLRRFHIIIPGLS